MVHAFSVDCCPFFITRCFSLTTSNGRTWIFSATLRFCKLISPSALAGVKSCARHGLREEKMKKVCLKVPIFTLILLSLTSVAQVKPEDVLVKNNSFEHVFQSSIPANTKQLNAKQWVAKNFGDYKSVLQFEDDANHRIIIKGTMTIYDWNRGESVLIIEDNHSLSFTLTIDNKDDRFRARIEDMKVHVVRNSYVLGRKSNLTDEVISCDEYLDLTTDTLIKQAELVILQQELEELNGGDINKLSRKERKNREDAIAETEKKITNKKSDIEVTIKNHQKQLNSFRQSISTLMNSLFASINKDDDF